MLVLLAVYNGAAYLDEQLDSVLAQVDVDVKVVVSLDPSSDNSETLLRRRIEIDPRVELLPTLPTSGGAAQNFFRLVRDADMHNCDYVCFCDQDDIWLQGKLARAAKCLHEQGAQAYSSNVIAFWPDGRQVDVVKSQDQCRWDHWFEAAGPGCTYVFSRKLATSLQAVVRRRWDKLQPVALHDWFSYAYARQLGCIWVIDATPWVRYRQHADNEVGANLGWNALLVRARLFWNGWLYQQSLLIAEALEASNDAFVQRWSQSGRPGLLWLAWHARQCRRRPRDVMLFALACGLMAIRGWHRT